VKAQNQSKGQFHTTVSVPDKERIKINVLTENTLDFIATWLDASPKKTLCCLALQCDTSKSAPQQMQQQKLTV
jgi:hypothetical protein